jgi:hypothetical protein
MHISTFDIAFVSCLSANFPEEGPDAQVSDAQVSDAQVSACCIDCVDCKCHDRRSVWQGVGYAGLATLLAPGASLPSSPRAEAVGEPLIQPTEIRSRNGELNVTLTAAISPMRLGDIEFQGFL